VVTLTDATKPRFGTIVRVDPLGYPRTDEDRTVDLVDDDEPVLPEQTRDDTDRGWGEWTPANDDRLLDDRPPHWDA
jgi:hypothetical protein